MTGDSRPEIGRLFWLSWLVVIAAFNAWMWFGVHPHTSAYNGYDELYWVCGDLTLLVVLIINAAILVTIRDRRRRRSPVSEVP